MEYVIKFLADFEVPIYLILGIVAVVYLRRIVISLEEKRTAIFGLEREAAQRKVTAAASILILVGLMTVLEFVVATFLAGELSQAPTFATPTIEMLTTPTTTLPGPVPTDATPTPTLYPQAQIEGIDSQCVNDILEIESPLHDGEVSGVVEITGSVNSLPWAPTAMTFQQWASPIGKPLPPAAVCALMRALAAGTPATLRPDLTCYAWWRWIMKAAKRQPVLSL